MVYCMDEITMQDKDSGVMAALAYVVSIFFPLLGPVLVYLLKKDDRYVRFHALQSAFFDIALSILWMFLFILYIITMITIICAFLITFLMYLTFFFGAIARIVMAYCALNAKMFDLPVIGPFVRKYV
ncbi:MAG: DUF4870 domain-containing protein [Candidatus Micrarchaeia archaeon]